MTTKPIQEVSKTEADFMLQLLFYLKTYHPDTLKAMYDAGIEIVADTLEQISSGSR